MLATFLVLGTRVFGSAGLPGKRPSAARRNPFSVTIRANGRSFADDHRDPPIKLINGHRDFGAAKLPRG
jgi:hypothetical protein